MHCCRIVLGQRQSALSQDSTEPKNRHGCIATVLQVAEPEAAYNNSMLLRLKGDSKAKICPWFFDKSG